MENKYFPDLYKSASTEAKSAQRIFFLCLGVNLVCLVTSVALANLTPRTSVLSVLQAIALIVGLLSMLYLRFADPQGDWYAARALAESVKTMTWRFCMCAEPYQNEQATEHFIDNLGKVLKDNAYISHKVVDLQGKQVPDFLKATRLLSLNKRKQFYREKRIDEQRVWYSKKSKFNDKRSKQFFFVIFLLYSAAILISLLRIESPQIEPWYVDFITAIAASLLAWVQAKKHQELAASYGLTAHEIGFLSEKLERTKSVEEFSLFVGDAENAFSREHTQWRARRDIE